MSNKEKALRVTYATHHDPKDQKQWSGSIHHLEVALKSAGLTVDVLGNLQRGRVLLSKALGRLAAISNSVYNPLVDPTRNFSMAERFAHQIEEHMKETTPNVLFSPSSIPIALVNSGVPKVFFTDTTFAGLIDTYTEVHEFPKGYLEEGHRLEKEAILSSDLVLYTSEWAVRSAIDRYGADPSKMKIVPFGANLDEDPSEATVRKDIKKRSKERLELLFLGVVWERKGGPKALEVATLLHEQGIPVRLRVIGCVPPLESLPSFVEVTPYVSKNNKKGRDLLSNAIRSSHFLVLPTKAECFGIVFAEAAAYGVPSISHDVGGVSSAISEGVSGHLFDADSDAKEMATTIASLFLDRAGYEALGASTFAQYKARLNWKVNGALIAEHLRSVAR